MRKETFGFFLSPRLLGGLVVVGVLLLTAGLSRRPSLTILGLLVAGLGGLLLLQQPRLSFYGLVAFALLIPFSVRTGTEVALNLASLLQPVVLVMGWFDRSFRGQGSLIVPSTTNKPLVLFLLAGWVSLLIGNAIWDPAVPISGNFIIVQLAQLAIFAFSAIVFWLMGSMMRKPIFLQRLTWFYLVIAGSLAIVRVLPGTNSLREAIATFALDRAPFWLLLAAVGGGQLLFNRGLSLVQRGFLIAVEVAVLYYCLVLERATLSNLAGVAPALAMLVWLRWPKLQKAIAVLAVVAAVVGFPMLYSYAGGEAEWEESGGSRLALQGRVIEVTMRNPITGIGPAAYRAYARMKPLLYERAYYVSPTVNSHNNYIDLFSQLGVVGVALFLWFSVRLIQLGFKVVKRHTQGFASGYANAMLAAWVAGLVLMMFADWILPFVYNIGFPGFQASVLVWAFEGGLVALDHIPPLEPREGEAGRSQVPTRR